MKRSHSSFRLLSGTCRGFLGKCRAWMILMVAGIAMLSGCASLPDVNRIQGNMDAMVHYMGVMASNMPVMSYSTSRMAALAEKMDRKSDSLMNDIQKKGGSAERAIQNYSQAVLDNERGVIKNLKAIKDELGEIRHSLGAPGAQPESRDQSRINAELQSRLTTLEAKLRDLSTKVDQDKGR